VKNPKGRTMCVPRKRPNNTNFSLFLVAQTQGKQHPGFLWVEQKMRTTLFGGMGGKTSTTPPNRKGVPPWEGEQGGVSHLISRGVKKMKEKSRRSEANRKLPRGEKKFGSPHHRQKLSRHGKKEKLCLQMKTNKIKRVNAHKQSWKPHKLFKGWNRLGEKKLGPTKRQKKTGGREQRKGGGAPGPSNSPLDGLGGNALFERSGEKEKEE